MTFFTNIQEFHRNNPNAIFTISEQFAGKTVKATYESSGSWLTSFRCVETNKLYYVNKEQMKFVKLSKKN